VTLKKPSTWGFFGLSFYNRTLSGGFMFPKFDYLFNIGLVVCLAYLALVIGNAIFKFALLLIGG